MAKPFPKVFGFGCPSIRTKALSSNTSPARCFSHRVVARELEDKELWKSHGESLPGETVPPTTPRRGTMTRLSESRPAPGRPAGGAAFSDGLPWVPDPSRFLGRVGVPVPSSIFLSPASVLCSFSRRIDPHQSTLHRIHMHVFELLHLLLVTPHIEIVKSPLPELRPRILSSKLKLELANNCFPPHLPRHSLLQHLQHRRRRPFRRLAHQQMNVFRHHHKSHQRKSVSITHLAQDFYKQIPRPHRPQQRQAPVTTAGDEMQIVLAVIPLKFSMHRNR